MIEMRLYKEPFSEPWEPGKVRLLFECGDQGTALPQSGLDFYVYVWIENGKQCTGFQAILDGEYVLEFHAPAHVSFGRIGNRPISRSIKEAAPEEERRRMVGILQRMHHERFARLLEGIAKTGRGETIGPLILTGQEQRFFEELLKNNNRPTDTKEL